MGERSRPSERAAAGGALVGGEVGPRLDDAAWYSLVEAMHEPVVAADEEGRILHANPACERAFGHAPSELAGRNVRCLMPEPYRFEHDGYLERYRRTGLSSILGRPRELPVLHRDGRRVWCELSIAEVRLAGRERPIYCASFRDVTASRDALQALANSEARFRAIFEQEAEFVCLVDREGRLADANPAAVADVGGPRERWLGRPWLELPWWVDSPEARADLDRALAQASNGSRVRLTVVDGLIPGGHRHLDVQLSGLPDAEGRITSVLVEVRDVSLLVHAREQGRALDRTFAELGESASLLAHEIKTPLTSLNLALRAVSEHLGQDERALLDDLAGRLRRLQGLMNRTLSLVRPIALEHGPCDPAALLDAARGEVAPEAEQAGVRIDVQVAPEAPPAWGDRGALDEVLVNLVQNALEAVGPDGRVRLAAEPCPGGLSLSVEDDGPGIPEPRRAEVFKPFVTSRADGSGLGLALARKIVDAHGGSIDVGDSPLGGARFRLVLPAATARRPSRAANPHRA